MRKRRLENRALQRITAWEHETAELERKLRRADDPPDQYFAGALRVVQLKTALSSPVARLSQTRLTRKRRSRRFDLPDEKRDRMRELFRQSDELRYSGRPNGKGTIAEETRREVLELIESLT